MSVRTASGVDTYTKLIARCDEAVLMLDTIHPPAVPDIWCPPIADLIRDLVQALDDTCDELEAVERELANVLGEGDTHE